jgi:hypothetical protein
MGKPIESTELNAKEEHTLDPEKKAKIDRILGIV